MTERKRGGGEGQKPKTLPNAHNERVNFFRDAPRQSYKFYGRVRASGPKEITGVEKHIDTTFQESIEKILIVIKQPDLAGLIGSEVQLIDAVIEISKHPEIIDAMKKLVGLGMTKDSIREILKNRITKLYKERGDESEMAFAHEAGNKFADIIIEFAEDEGVFDEPSTYDEPSTDDRSPLTTEPPPDTK